MNGVEESLDIALLEASIAGRDEVLQELLEAKANVNFQGQLGAGLRASCNEGHVKCVRLLQTLTPRA